MTLSENRVPLKSIKIAEHFPSEKMPAVYTTFSDRPDYHNYEVCVGEKQQYKP
jgi:hypothetical protein